MIVVEEVLRDVFCQLPKVNFFEMRFNWGSQNALNLYLSQLKNTVKYPLIWLVESNETVSLTDNNIERKVKFIIAKQSAHTTNTNPIIWETEFKTVLNPILENVIKALETSGKTTILDGDYQIQRLSNYSETNEKSTYTIDNWNAIVLELNLRVYGNKCINKNIKF